MFSNVISARYKAANIQHPKIPSYTKVPTYILTISPSFKPFNPPSYSLSTTTHTPTTESHKAKSKMPQSILIPGGHNTSASCLKPTQTFTGDVYLDPIYADPDAVIANVTFAPCARTHWHTHEKGQLIRVVAGNGWICDREGQPRRLRTGDVVWAPAATTHWHGADDGSVMTHFVLGIGRTEWHEEVTEGEYKGKKEA